MENLSLIKLDDTRKLMAPVGKQKVSCQTMESLSAFHILAYAKQQVLTLTIALGEVAFAYSRNKLLGARS